MTRRGERSVSFGCGPVQYRLKPRTPLTFYALQKQSHCALGFGISWVNVATQKEWRHQFAQGKGTVYSWSGPGIISITPSPHRTPSLSTAVPHPPKPASCFECPFKTQLVLLGCGAQTLPGISMNSVGSPRGLRPSAFITAKSNAMSLGQSNFPKVILTLSALWCCVSHPGEDKPPGGQISVYLPTKESREGCSFRKSSRLSQNNQL